MTASNSFPFAPRGCSFPRLARCGPAWSASSHGRGRSPVFRGTVECKGVPDALFANGPTLSCQTKRRPVFSATAGGRGGGFKPIAPAGLFRAWGLNAARRWSLVTRYFFNQLTGGKSGARDKAAAEAFAERLEMAAQIIRREAERSGYGREFD